MRKLNFAVFVVLLGLPSAFAFAAETARLENSRVAMQRASEENRVPVPALVKAGKPSDVLPPQPVREWTLMLFMNGRSNVETFAMEDMNELELAGSSEKINVVAELGRMEGTQGDSGPEGKWTGSKRYYVIKDPDTSTIKSPALSYNPKPDMGDYHEVVSFVQWAKKTFPAKRYSLIIWDHGWGWMDPSKPMTRSISHDFASGNAIKTTQLKTMFSQLGPIDMYASMGCFMQMMEVSYEIKDYAKVIVGSEEVIQLPSFDFDAFINLLAAKPQSDAEAAGKYLVSTFKNLYSDPANVAPGYGVQLSAIRANKLAGVKSAMDGWIKAVSAAGDTAALKAALRDVIRFEVGDENTDPSKKKSPYADLGDFIRIYTANLTVPGPQAQAARAAGQALLAALKDMTVANTGFGKDRVGNDFSQTTGIGLDIPGVQEGAPLLEHEDTYGRLDFVKNGLWKDFHKQLEQLNKPEPKK
ncbi:MAG: hypothetical protein GX410_02795 [Elusimicrobia bacterium]|nr:hypothetical protein [Elusimicrobiota bacterium]